MKNTLTIVLLTLSVKSYTQVWVGKCISDKDTYFVYPAQETKPLLFEWTGSTWIKQINCDSLTLELQFWKDKYNELLYQLEKLRLEELKKVQLPYKLNEWNKDNFFLNSNPSNLLQTIPKDSIILELNNRRFKIIKDSNQFNNHIYLIKD